MNHEDASPLLSGRWLVVLLATPWILATFLPAAVTPGIDPPLEPTGSEVAPGQIAFEALKCDLCHAVSNRGIERRSKSEKMQARDLAGVGEDFDRAFAERYLRQEDTLEGEKHKKPFKGTDEELQAILDWLSTL